MKCNGVIIALVGKGSIFWSFAQCESLVSNGFHAISYPHRSRAIFVKQDYFSQMTTEWNYFEVNFKSNDDMLTDWNPYFLSTTSTG